MHRLLGPAASRAQPDVVVNIRIPTVAIFCLAASTGCDSPSAPGDNPVLGDRIVFRSDRHDAGFDIYSMALDGTAVRRLTDDRLFESCPTVSPNGRSIAYFQSSEGGTPNLMLMRADGSGKTALGALLGYAHCPQWSNGNDILGVIYYTAGGSGFDFTLKLFRSDGAVVGQFNTNAPNFQFSRDGKNLVLVEYTSGSWPDDNKISIVSLDGSARRELTSGIAPVWSPTSDVIAYLCRDDDPINPRYDNTCVINSDGTGQRRLLTDYSDWVSFSPDGGKLAVKCDGGWVCILSLDGTLLSKTSAQGLGAPFIWAREGDSFIGSCPSTDPAVTPRSQGEICRVKISATRDVVYLTRNPAQDDSPSMAATSPQ